MKTPTIVATAAIALGLASGFSAPVRADTASSAALGAALGAIAGSLLFDSSHNQYYYVRDNHRYYVSNDQAREYYRRRDPDWYNRHQRDFDRHPDQFSHDWNSEHRH